MSKIKEIRVEKLFDIFNHKIEFKEGGITILHGENGFGKTTLLRMIESLFTKKLEVFKEIIFKKFVVVFDDETWEIIKEIDKNKIKLILNSESDPKGKNIYELSIDEFGSKNENNGFMGYFSQWQRNFLENNNAVLIKTDRLNSLVYEEFIDRTRDEEYEDIVEIESVLKYSNEIVEQLEDMLAASSHLGRKLDSSYPMRLAKKKNEREKENLKEEINYLNEKRELYYKLGILDTEEIQEFQYTGDEDEFMKTVLSVYVEDNKKKLEILDDIARKIDIYLNIINKRFLYKKLNIDRERGFVFTSEITGKEIPMKGLSSGEQHEIVLFYSLLFKTKPNTLLLIDEPEISLHISWQNEFVNDLKKIVELTDIYILIATHSPSIIGNNWELAVELEEI